MSPDERFGEVGDPSTAAETAGPPRDGPPAPGEPARGGGADPGAGPGPGPGPGGNMLPGRERRRFGLERLLMRLIATAGIIGIGVAIGAILASSKVQGWITGLVVAAVSVVLSAILWSSRQL